MRAAVFFTPNALSFGFPLSPRKHGWGNPLLSNGFRPTIRSHRHRILCNRYNVNPKTKIAVNSCAVNEPFRNPSLAPIMTANHQNALVLEPSLLIDPLAVRATVTATPPFLAPPEPRRGRRRIVINEVRRHCRRPRLHCAICDRTRRRAPPAVRDSRRPRPDVPQANGAGAVAYRANRKWKSAGGLKRRKTK